MQDSPRVRRLRNDQSALDSLRADSSVFDFTATQLSPQGVAEAYLLRFYGKGLWRADAASPVLVREYHEVAVRLGAAYPRLMPELAWKTPIFHPNVSYGGVVCLGGYGKFWAPSLCLAELCTMLWDMLRYQNYDVKSPYNREAATWVSGQSTFPLPVDGRPIRDRVAGYRPRRPVPPVIAPPLALRAQRGDSRRPAPAWNQDAAPSSEPEIVFLD